MVGWLRSADELELGRDLTVAERSAIAIGQLRQAEQLMRERYLHHPTSAKRWTAARTLGQLDPAQMRDEWTEELARRLGYDRSATVRRAIIEALGNVAHQTPRAHRELTACCEDPDESVRAAAMRALCVSESFTPLDAEVLVLHLDDPVPAVRHAAMQERGTRAPLARIIEGGEGDAPPQ